VTARWRALARRVEREARGVARGRGDALHDLRVACRRLEASLRLWGRGNAAREARLLARDLRRAAAPARETQVVRAMLIEGDAGASVLPQDLRKAWAAELAADAPRAKLPRRNVAKLRARVERAARKLAGRDAEQAQALSKRRLAAWRVAGMRALVAGIADGGAEPLHMARLALKRWRYAEGYRTPRG
jgi:CHAD domain-containing protein